MHAQADWTDGVIMKADRKILCVSVLLAIVSWVAEAVIHNYWFGEESFLNALIPVFPGHEVYTRLTQAGLILLFGVLMSVAIARRKVAERDLAEAVKELDVKVAKRTEMLRCANEHLAAELDGHRKTALALQESEARLRNLSLQLLAAREQERREISRELHDEFGQTLALLKQRLWRILKRLNGEKTDLADELEKGLESVADIIENVRRITRNLSPLILEYGGLTAALRTLIGDFSQHYGIDVTTQLIDIDRVIPQESHIPAYRIFQEILNNIGKHASASHVCVHAEKSDSTILFRIEDNGRGFNVDGACLGNARGKGLGLAILDERVKMLRGSFNVWSEEGKGIRISFTIPANPVPSGQWR